MASSGFNRIHSALAKFQNDYGTKSNSNYSEDLRGPSLQANDDPNDLSGDVFLYSHHLDRDWMLLRMFTVSVHEWSDAGKLLKNSGRGEWVCLVLTIEAVAHEIARVLWQSVCYSSGTPSELLNLFEDCKRVTDPFKAEIGQVLDYFSQSGGCSYHVDPPLIGDYSHWSDLFGSVIEGLLFIENTSYGLNDPSLRKQVYAFHEELNLMQKYLYDVKVTSSSSSGILSDHVVQEFLSHVASVVVHTANQYCNYWISHKIDQIQVANRKLVDELLSLHHEIDPTNLEFLYSSLKFLRALGKISPCQTVNLVKSFCQYLLTGRGNSDLKNELESLVTYVINNKLEDDNSPEDVQSICAEIIALLVEAASLHETVRKESTANCPSCYELLTKVCLLKAECFLKAQLQGKTLLKIEEINEVLERQRRFTIYLPHESIEYGNKMLAFTEEVAEEVASLYRKINKIKKSTVKNSLLRLLFNIVIFKAESFLIELVKSNNASFGVHGIDHDQIQSLLEELEFFKRILTNRLLIKIPEEMKMIIIQIEPVFRRITFFSYLFHTNKITQETINEIIKLLKR